MTEKTKKCLYWILGAVGICMAAAGFVCKIEGLDKDWSLIAVITGFAIILISMITQPITKKEIINGSMSLGFITAIVWSFLAMSWILDIDQFTPLKVVIVIIDVIVLLVSCVLAYRKKQHFKALKEEYVNSKKKTELRSL